MTGDWIDNSFDSFNKIIDFSPFNNRHTAIEIAVVMKQKLILLGVYEKLICITCDGAENLVLACQYLNNDINRIWCCAHGLHLVMINALGFWLPEIKMDNDFSKHPSTGAATDIMTSSNFIDDVSENQAMNIDWDNELSGVVRSSVYFVDLDSWSINEFDCEDEASEEMHILIDDIDGTEGCELIDDSWSTNSEGNVESTEQKRYAYFDPTSHLCLNDTEKYQIECYIKQLIMDDVYPLEMSTTNNSIISSSNDKSSSIFSITNSRLRQESSDPTDSKLSVYDEFLAACAGEETAAVGNVKEKSKRACLNDELKYFKLLVQEFNAANKPRATSALRF